MTSPDNTGAGSRKAAPFYTGMLNGKKVRFFLSPDEGERLPWACLDDIITAAKMDAASRRHAHILLRDTSTFPSEVVATPEGLARIASNTTANSFTSALVHLKKAPKKFDGEFGVLQVAALDAPLPNMSDLDRLNYAIAARRNEDGVPGPHPMIGARS